MSLYRCTSCDFESNDYAHFRMFKSDAVDRRSGATNDHPDDFEDLDDQMDDDCDDQSSREDRYTKDQFVDGDCPDCEASGIVCLD
ncbi:MAG: hypothetical protein Q7K13_01460 [Polynucleobacter sp.]|uniref:hypothetical protein n=1 Tax=Polynucleobacter sp. TaxID=2029855 RepID=UPI002721E6D5|nr:hypothetical protein [Polynucleobacter sp.]MDO8713138.1 hypothetical protein [Polynucleobacter sp.]